MKSWGEYVYVTTDRGRDGLLVIHMAGAPDNITWEFWQPELTANNNTDTLKTCHNIYIDEFGYAYLAGCNLNSGGPLILDVHTTPGTPIYVGASDPRYSHDVYVRDNIVYSSDINNGFFSIIDVQDKANPVTLAVQETSSRFTHNAWLSDDGKVLFTTDERPNAYIDAYDVSDFDNIRFLDNIRPLATEGTGVIPHNVHVIDDYLVISWYTDGVKIIDASKPDNLIEVGSYDTYQLPAGGFNGCWGAYPWLPSGLVLASDINSGLYILEPEYVRAARLEGIVRNTETGLPVNDVRIDIESEQVAYGRTGNNGVFKTGLATAGTYTIQVQRSGFRPYSTVVTLLNGEVTFLEIDLVPLQKFNLKARVLDAKTELPVPGAQIQFSGTGNELSFQADEEGEVSGEILEGIYEVVAGSWGYKYSVIQIEAADQLDEQIFYLDAGYQDDFVFDFGWEVTGDAVIGHWERGVPEATFFNGTMANPGSAFPDALGKNAYVTGLAAGNGPGDFDLDDGYTFLTSPTMDLTGYERPGVQYARWFFNSGGFGQINDTLVVYVSNGEEEVILEKVWGATNGWDLSAMFEISNLIEFTQEMRIIFEASDLPGSGHLVEAGVDFFSVVELATTPTDDINLPERLSFYPNPARGELTVVSGSSGGLLKMMNITGHVIQLQRIPEGSETFTFNLSELPPGMYLLQLETSTKVKTGKLIVK
jgi:choice-of-anchor B domain-containing protein